MATEIEKEPSFPADDQRRGHRPRRRGRDRRGRGYAGSRPRILGKHLAPSPQGQGRLSRWRVHHFPDHRCLRRGTARRPLLGHGPNDQFFIGGVDSSLLPAKPWTHVPTPSGGKATPDPRRRLDPWPRRVPAHPVRAQISIEVGIGAMVLSMTIGLVLGSAAGYFRGTVDTVISRLTEITMAFPYCCS